MAAKHVGLGRGLGALIKENSPAKPVATPPAEKGSKDHGITQIPIRQIQKSPWQPRRHFDAAALADLVASVREHGVLQPLLVRRVKSGYQLIAGERRLRASQEAELKEVPVIVMEVSDREALEITLIENLQREDLNPIEEAEGFQSLADQFSLTQEQIAERVGKRRATVANSLRLLSLSDPVKKAIADNRLSVGHAKVLLGLEIPREQEQLAQRVIKEALSVRALEKIVENLRKAPRRPRVETPDIPATHLQHLTEQLHQRLGTSVRLTSNRTLGNGKKLPGRIEVDFYSTDDLDRLLIMLGISDNF